MPNVLSTSAVENGLGFGSGVDAVGFDGNNERSGGVKEVVRIQSNDSWLIGLRHNGKYSVNHVYQHAAREGLARVFNGTMFGRFLSTFVKSRQERCENSAA
ncbi:hypothetical protein EMWEY_00027620 [Eimeria maxima]|uniref:Uncharacterized protein n=1 Tax=Eimeria maxima TaxID=5804 RepID=U6MCE0_EIMMA|nr:hypothetical protein EMWEY_00027620 [Eimeria maxima]CDJ60109.1 hypothetical protein EMWEY_00027620 [Eimeria maxima]